ncbi:unnamed protein product [Brachionus calyciflorus]|uniref:Uncharacterized protein n=1 Tax=Brachionus calyciflorus TaxID=104777 RepID=A0A814F2L5_9BILA|nr:unnamed protein product [Brachionus calyciflorus]
MTSLYNKEIIKKRKKEKLTNKDAISKIRNSTEIEFKTVEELKNFIQTTVESFDEEKSNIHKEAEDKNLQKEFTDDATSNIEKLEVADKSLSEEKEGLKTVLENERHETQLSPQPNPKTFLFSDLQTKQLVTPKYDLGRTASNSFNIKADQYSAPYTPYGSKIDIPLIFKPSQSQLINNNLGTNNLVVPKTIKKMDPLTPKFTGTSKEDVENWLFTIEQSFNKALISYTDRLVETIPFVGDYPFDLLRIHIMKNRSWKEYETTLRKTFSKTHKSDKFTTELINL